MINSTIVTPFSSLYLVQDKVKSHIKYNIKLDNYGKVEDWILPDVYTETNNTKNIQHEEFAKKCRYICQYGKFASRILIGQSANLEYKCMLLVGDWVLDLANDEPVHIDMLHDINDYTLLYISGYQVDDIWSPYV